MGAPRTHLPNGTNSRPTGASGLHSGLEPGRPRPGGAEQLSGLGNRTPATARLSRHHDQRTRPNAVASSTGQAQTIAGCHSTRPAPAATPITKPAVATISAFSGFMFRLPFRSEPEESGNRAPCGLACCLRPVPESERRWKAAMGYWLGVSEPVFNTIRLMIYHDCKHA